MSGIIEIKHVIIRLLSDAISIAQSDGKIPSLALPEITVEHPQNPSYGDYASSISLKLARTIGKNPMLIAKDIVVYIKNIPEIEKVSVAPPGFINFTLKNDWLTRQVADIIKEGEQFGSSDIGRSKRVQIEFVSANPTGPLHVGNGRGAILGSTLANVLKLAGFFVEKEYYVNDAGNQITVFYNSLFARYQQELGMAAEMPENGYMGRYMVDLAKEIIAENGDVFLKMPETVAVEKLGQIGQAKMVDVIQSDLSLLDVKFDVWFSEKSLYDNDQYNHVMSLLKQSGYIAEKEGAVWFVSTALGEDKDNVVIRGDGTPTYFASDIAYHYNKFVERQFEKVIDIWGADHQGHVSRMKAVVSALRD